MQFSLIAYAFEDVRERLMGSWLTVTLLLLIRISVPGWLDCPLPRWSFKSNKGVSLDEFILLHWRLWGRYTLSGREFGNSVEYKLLLLSDTAGTLWAFAIVFLWASSRAFEVFISLISNAKDCGPRDISLAWLSELFISTSLMVPLFDPDLLWFIFLHSTLWSSGCSGILCNLSGCCARELVRDFEILRGGWNGLLNCSARLLENLVRLRLCSGGTAVIALFGIIVVDGWDRSSALDMK